MTQKSQFGFAKPRHSPGFLLWQTTVMWQRLIKKVLEQSKISHAQFVIMALLLWLNEQKQETTQVAIISLSLLDKMTVSQSLKKLVERGYVLRSEHTQDTRAKSVTLTESGKSLIGKLIPLVEQVDANFFSKIPDQDQPKLLSILQELTEENNV